jgi:hypothetical protein
MQQILFNALIMKTRKRPACAWSVRNYVTNRFGDHDIGQLTLLSYRNRFKAEWRFGAFNDLTDRK